jgi:hypothetical protein
VQDSHEALQKTDIARLIDRAATQEQTLERERMAAGEPALRAG